MSGKQGPPERSSVQCSAVRAGGRRSQQPWHRVTATCRQLACSARAGRSAWHARQSSVPGAVGCAVHSGANRTARLVDASSAATSLFLTCQALSQKRFVTALVGPEALARSTAALAPRQFFIVTGTASTSALSRQCSCVQNMNIQGAYTNPSFCHQHACKLSI